MKTAMKPVQTRVYVCDVCGKEDPNEDVIGYCMEAHKKSNCKHEMRYKYEGWNYTSIMKSCKECGLIMGNLSLLDVCSETLGKMYKLMEDDQQQ